MTWWRFAIWCVVGVVNYVCYGLWHSTIGEGGTKERYALDDGNVIKLNNDASSRSLLLLPNDTDSD